MLARGYRVCNHRVADEQGSSCVGWTPSKQCVSALTIDPTGTCNHSEHYSPFCVSTGALFYAVLSEWSGGIGRESPRLHLSDATKVDHVRYSVVPNLLRMFGALTLCPSTVNCVAAGCLLA